ncbi:SpoIIE family protein phosphatase [Streptomyces sp. NPDC047000]|uniref:SpoIIE family protein phosphatase n=1 Tax=Streptomyces sp. NPDC047000 TaxID=3155474 RepID=UPI003411604B
MLNDVTGGEAGADGPAAVIDAGGLVAAWGEAARHALGYSPGEIVGRPAVTLLAEDAPPEVVRCVAERRECAGELVLRHRDGGRVVVRLRAVPLASAGAAPLWIVTGAAPEPPGGRAARGAPELWERALTQLPMPVAVYGPDARLVGANESMSRLTGRTEEEMRGLTLWEIAPWRPFDEFDRLQRQVLRTGETLRRETHTPSAGDTSERALSTYFSALKDESGRVTGMCATVFDITEQHRARRRLAVLNEAAVRIGSTLDVIRTTEELAEVAVAGFADFVTVDLLDHVVRGDEPRPPSDGTPVPFRRCAQRSVLPDCPEALFAPGDTDVYPAGSPPARALRTARSLRHRSGDAFWRDWVRMSPARDEGAARLGIHSLMMVPLRARGVTLGLVQFVRHRTPEPFGADDQLLAEEIAARAAVSVDNARRYTRERRTALALQRSLLPERLPQALSLEVAHRYLPAGSGDGVGGDWFDAIPLSGARVALVVGDVVGHGIHASATMGRLRTAVRTLADVDLAPDELLTQLDDLVLRLDREEGPEAREQPHEGGGEIGATCLYAVYDPVNRRCTLARAGHPPPALVAADGTARFLDLPPGPPLGLGGLPFESAEIDLAEGSTLALYTDGLLASADQDVDVALELLRTALGRPAATLDQTCEDVLHTVLRHRSADDVVLVLARAHALDAGQVRTWQVPSDPAAVAATRKSACEQVSAWGLEEAVFATELIVSELVTNAIRYGVPPVQLRLIRHETLICEVSDGSGTAPHMRRARIYDEGGRGLLLVAQLAERWGSRQTAAGKTIWAEQPLPPEA